jgi:putative ATP-dependent endonuclease of OLD family
MARLEKITIEDYKSIQHFLEIKFPNNMPVVFIGENNAGKTNIIRAIDLIFGNYHPKYKDLEDHDYYDRNPEREINIEANVSGFVNKLGRHGEYDCEGFNFRATKGKDNEFAAVQDDGEENTYVSNAIRNEISSIVVNGDKDLSYQLSYVSKYTLLSKVTKAFHKKLTEDEERVEKLKDLFKNIKSTFLEVPEFSQFKDNMSSIAGEVIKNMTYGLELDFSAYDPSNYFRSLRVNPSEDGEVRDFEELGTGQQQILALSFAHAYSKSFLAGSLLLIIDEPETHLHPLAQRWLARTMFSMAKDGLQLIITTHSPHFINLEFLPGINLIRKNEEGTIAISNNKTDLFEYCIANGSDPNRTKKDTVIPFYVNHSIPQILNGFFAAKVILVEGKTEELALPIYMEKAGFDTLKESVEIISVSGKGNIGKWWRLFTFYEIPTFVCFDNDSKNDGNGSKRKDALKTIGIPEDKIGELLTIQNWNINDEFCVFGNDFEDTMQESFPAYSEIEEQAKEELGSSKHIVARAIAEKLEYNEDHIGWQNISELNKKVRALSL